MKSILVIGITALTLMACNNPALDGDPNTDTTRNNMKDTANIQATPIAPGQPVDPTPGNNPNQANGVVRDSPDQR